jgi:putative multiple sugar transport system substrate-binding protein
LEYAEDDPTKQLTQIESMIDQKCQAILIAGADCYGLNDVLEKASKKKIKIIAYDRLIMDTPYVDYYVTFDNFEIGAEQGKYIIDTFDLDKGGVVAMELFSGALDDSCSYENYGGQMSVLQMYIDNGSIIIPSSQVSLQDTGIVDWSTENAHARMAGLLNDFYSGAAAPDVILSTNDSMALGIIKALKEAGYGSADKPFPLLTGMDCDIDNVIAILKGEQSMSMFIDTRALASRGVELVEDILMNRQPMINDTERYNNGVIIVPASICKSYFVDKDNYYDILIKSGYYKEEVFR